MNGCEESGECDIGNFAMAEGLQVHKEDIFLHKTKQGTIKLLAVGRSRYASWNCRRELVYLGERRSDGKLAALDPKQHERQYALDRVLAASRQRDRG